MGGGLLPVYQDKSSWGGNILADIKKSKSCKYLQVEHSRQRKQVVQQSEDSNELGIFEKHNKIQIDCYIISECETIRVKVRDTAGV